MLTKEYIKILLQNPYAYKNVLAITFTNKATGEMKQRILEELSNISEDKKSDLQLVVESEFSRESISINIVRNADLAYQNILHNYSRFEISTIDSFFTRIVRSCARELGLSSRYEIELGNDYAIEYAIKKLYEDLTDTGRIGKWLKEFSVRQIENDRGWEIDYQITDLARELFKEKIQMGFKNGFMDLSILEQKISEIKSVVKNFEKEVKSLASECIELIKESGLSSIDFKGGSRSFATTYSKIKGGKFDLTETFRKTVRENEGWYSKTSPAIDRIESALANGLLKKSEQLLDFYDQYWNEYVSVQEILKNYYSYALLGALNENVKSYRDENDLLLLSDTNSIIQQTISEDDAPFLFEKVGSRYEHILIDEFQDTSSYQWENLKPLVLSSLSAGNNVLIVGDVKQSIYRWRGGDMNLLLNRVKEDLKFYESETAELVLNDNWRSGKCIVEFNNQFFVQAIGLLKVHADISEPHLLEKAYSDIEQNPKAGFEGYVNVSLFDKEELQDTILEGLLKTIYDCVKDNFRLSDIMVLVDRGVRAIEVADYLFEHNINCITENALLLKNAAVIDLLISAVAWINQADEPYFRTQLVLKYINYGCIDDADIHKAISSSDYLEGLLKRSELEGLESKPPYELIQSLLGILDIKQNDVYVQTLLNNLLQLANKGVVSLNQFLEWWENEKDSLRVESPEHSDAVQIMTIHKSKGLESPVVVIPFADFLMKTRPGTTIWSDSLPEKYSEFGMLPLNFSEKLKESDFEESWYEEFIQGLIDRINVAYVAFTRAKERLYITGERAKKIKDTGKLNLLLQSVLENSEFEYSGFYDSEAATFEYGSRQQAVKKAEHAAEKVYKLDSSVPNKSEDKLQLKTESDEFFRLFDTDTSRNINKGLKIHLVLERMSSANDLASTVIELQKEGLLDEKDILEISNDVNSILSLPEVADWFQTNWTVVKEKEIWFDGRIYKPDRVLMKEREAVIIDFKKDRESSAHSNQLNAYATVIRKMGFEKVEKYLLYVEQRKVVKVA